MVRRHIYLYLSAGVAVYAAIAVMFAATSKDNDALEVFKAQYKRASDIPYPKDNPYSKAKAHLGKTLFFETRISHSGVTSCATCHNPGFDWTDGNAKGIGDHHQLLGRKDPTLLNLAWDELFFWDGRADSLEHQAAGPIKSEHEMNMPLKEAVAHLKAIPGYTPLFAAAFPREKESITEETITKAIATYVRTIVSGEAPFDRWVKGNEDAISAKAKQGFLLFNTKASCAACHTGWRFSDSSFHDIGLKDDDKGRGAFLPLPMMQHAFKTVGLRNIARRAPYMHDGSIQDLMQVMEHYDHGFIRRDSLADGIKPLHLTLQEKLNLIEFLGTLTSDDTPVTLPRMPK